MLAFASMALVLVVLLSGEIARLRVINRGINSAPSYEATAAYGFVTYKAAVQLYVFRNPGASGTIPDASLGFGANALGGITVGNQVIRGPNGTIIETWTTSGSISLQDILRISNGNRSIGTSSGTRWSTPMGGDMGPLPVSVPSGQIVSVVTVTGSGFSQ